MEEANERTALNKSIESVTKPSVDALMMSSPKPHQKTGLVHCVLKRSAGSGCLLLNKSSNKLVTLCFENDANTPVLRAEAVSTNVFAISSANSDEDSNHQILATLVRLQSNLTTITYGLRNADDVVIAVILYFVPNASDLLKGPPPRRAQVALLRDNFLSTSKNDTQSWFEAACRDSIQQHGNLDDLVGVQEVTLLNSKEPYLKSNGNKGLNFHGRGRRTSNKNMQLTDTITSNNNQTTTTAQMAKWDTDQFHLDYSVDSMNPITAFAFGLAQLCL